MSVVLPVCNHPWIDPIVNAFAVNTTPSAMLPNTFNYHCTAPGVCNAQITNDSYGSLMCNVGNSRYSCEFATPEAATPTNGWCVQDGILSVTRSMPCCPPMLSQFLSTQPCISGLGILAKLNVCCTTGGCSFAPYNVGCSYSFSGFSGRTTAVYTGFGPDITSCIQEVALGMEVEPSCFAVSAPPLPMCTLGGSGPPLPTTASTTSPTGRTSLLPTGSSAGPTPSPAGPGPRSSNGAAITDMPPRGMGLIKWVTILLIAPMLLQIL